MFIAGFDSEKEIVHFYFILLLLLLIFFLWRNFIDNNANYENPIYNVFFLNNANY